jgi:hypothetical protein
VPSLCARAESGWRYGLGSALPECGSSVLAVQQFVQVRALDEDRSFDWALVVAVDDAQLPNHWRPFGKVQRFGFLHGWGACRDAVDEASLGEAEVGQRLRRAAPDFGVFRQAAVCGDVGWIVRGGQLYGLLVVDEDSASADRVRAGWQLQSLGDVRWRGDGVDGEQLVAESARFGGDVGGGVDDERPPVADVDTLANAADQ